MPAVQPLIAEFSLALNNRTGKYFALADVIERNRDYIDEVRFWRLSRRSVPTGLYAKVLGRLMTWEVELRARYSQADRLLPRLRPKSRVLFTDPLQVMLYRLRRDDVVVVHDLGPVLNPEYYARFVGEIYRQVFSTIRNAGCHLVFVSDASRQAYRSCFGDGYASATVIYNPVRQEVLGGDERAPVGVGAKYLLTVGAVGARKNQAGLCRAFSLSGLAASGVQLVICGGPEPGFEIVRSEVERTPGALLLGYVDPAELRWLYKHATGFVLPSLLEGFGMPAAEALVRGLVPLLSRDAALIEVAGEGGLYVDSLDDEAIAEGLLKIVSLTPGERKVRLQAGRDKLDRFDENRVRDAWRRFFAERD